MLESARVACERASYTQRTRLRSEKTLDGLETGQNPCAYCKRDRCPVCPNPSEFFLYAAAANRPLGYTKPSHRLISSSQQTASSGGSAAYLGRHAHLPVAKSERFIRCRESFAKYMGLPPADLQISATLSSAYKAYLG